MKTTFRKSTFALAASLAMGLCGSAMAQTASPSSSTPEPQKPHGCLAYGAAGAVGGHFVRSGHAKMGAVAGCAYGWHKKHEWKKEHAAWEAQQKAGHSAPASSAPSTPSTTPPVSAPQ